LSNPIWERFDFYVHIPKNTSVSRSRSKLTFLSMWEDRVT
jgi:hypothetical protein